MLGDPLCANALTPLYHYILALGHYFFSFAWLALHWRLVRPCPSLRHSVSFEGEKQGAFSQDEGFYDYFETNSHLPVALGAYLFVHAAEHLKSLTDNLGLDRGARICI